MSPSNANHFLLLFMLPMLVLCCTFLTACTGDRACDSCRLTRSVVLTLEGLDGDPRGWVAAASSPDRVLLISGGTALEFDGHGSPVHRIATDSAGPITSVASIGGDSIVLVRRDLLRIVEPARTRIDSVQLPAGTSVQTLHVIRWPDRIMFSGRAAGRSGIFMARIDSGFFVIDPNFRPPPTPRNVRGPEYRFARTREGGVRAVEIHTYEMLEFSDTGELLSKHQRNPSWFEKPARGRARGGMRSSVAGLWIDPDGRLWVYSRKATPVAGVVWRSEEARRPGGTVTAPIDAMYDIIVEVLDPRGRKLLATGRIPEHLVSLMTDGRVVLLRNDPAAGVRLSVQQLRLQEDASN